MKRIGLFGGTFDPPHKGHLAIAEQALTQLGLDRVYFIPAYIPPHKQQHNSTTARHRMNMMKAAVRGRHEFKASSIELRRRGISYTVDTLKAFKKRFPTTELVLILGADNLMQFQTWKSPKTILQLASLAVYKRKGFHRTLNAASLNYILLKGPLLQLSSTAIRIRVANGLSIQALVPESIVRYIKQHVLYSKTIPHFSKKVVP